MIISFLSRYCPRGFCPRTRYDVFSLPMEERQARRYWKWFVRCHKSRNQFPNDTAAVMVEFETPRHKCFMFSEAHGCEKDTYGNNTYYFGIYINKKACHFPCVTFDDVLALENKIYELEENENGEI